MISLMPFPVKKLGVNISNLKIFNSFHKHIYCIVVCSDRSGVNLGEKEICVIDNMCEIFRLAHRFNIRN